MKARSGVIAEAKSPRLIQQAVLLFLLWVGASSVDPVSAEVAVAFRNVEGRVVAVALPATDGEPALLRADIEIEGELSVLGLLLAPTTVCDEIGFEVGVGDFLRARVFVEEGEEVRVQKVLSLSRGTMVRFRTMHQIPLWDSTGAWNGGEIRTGPGPHRIRARGRPERRGTNGGGAE